MSAPAHRAVKSDKPARAPHKLSRVKIVSLLAIGALCLSGVGYAAADVLGTNTCTNPVADPTANADGTTTYRATCSLAIDVPAGATSTTTAPGSTGTVTETAPGSTTTATATVTATTTVTTTPTVSVTPTPTITTTPPTTTPPVTTTPPPPGSFPNASNTGPPAGTIFRTIKASDTGPCWHVELGAFDITCKTTIDSFIIPFPVNVFADDVTITRTKIKAASAYIIKTCDCPTHYSGLTLKDSDIDGSSNTASQSIAVMNTVNATYLRDNFHGMASSGPRLDTGNLLQDNYIHDFVCKKPDHSAGTSINGAGTNLQIIHNTVDINTTAAGCASAAIELSAQDFGGTINGATIDSNWLAGGAYCLYADEDAKSASSTNVHITNNTFSKKYNPQCGLFGPVAELQAGKGNTFTGNHYDDAANTPISG